MLSRIDDSTIAAGTPVLVRRNAAVKVISISVLSEEEGEGVAMSKIIQTGSTAYVSSDSCYRFKRMPRRGPRRQTEEELAKDQDVLMLPVFMVSLI